MTPLPLAEPDYPQQLQALILADPSRLRLLKIVASLGLPDCWIGAGFVRNAVWDFLHGVPCGPSYADVDVIWFDPLCHVPDVDLALERRMAAIDGTVPWSVKNQGRMHAANGDPAYLSATDAMRCWPETATATALRWVDGEGAGTGNKDVGGIRIAAPYGLDDLYGGIIRPTPGFVGDKRAIFEARVDTKGWLARWPKLRVQR